MFEKIYLQKEERNDEGNKQSSFSCGFVTLRYSGT